MDYVDGRFRFYHIISGGSQVAEARHRPAVITIAQYEYPLYASFAAARRARRSDLVQWSADDVQPTAMGAADSKTRVIRVFPPPKTNRLGQQLHSVAELAEVLRRSLSEEQTGAAEQNSDTPVYRLPQRRASWFDRPFESTDKECEDFVRLGEILADLGVDGPEQLTGEVREKVLASEKLQLSAKVATSMLDGLVRQETAYHGEVWVMAEHEEGQINAATLELTGKARELADSLEVPVGVVLAGHRVGELAPELIAAGADKVYLLDDPLLEDFDPTSYRLAVADLFNACKPQIMLYGATPQGRVLAPMVAYRVGCGLTADCTELTIADISRKGQLAVMLQTRPALGGNVMATICSRQSVCQMATARPGVMQRRPADPSRRGEIIEHRVELSEGDLSLAIVERLSGCDRKVDFACDVIVGGGKGLASRENYARLLDELVTTVGEKHRVKAGKGASRAAVEQGYVERAFQVGQTGTAVAPRVYLAVGISGAIQHMIGVAASRTIIAINADPQAPIFKQSDYYLVGRAEQVIPELIEILQ